jgi:hypothetical protein
MQVIGRFKNVAFHDDGDDEFLDDDDDDDEY